MALTRPYTISNQIFTLREFPTFTKLNILGIGIKTTMDMLVFYDVSYRVDDSGALKMRGDFNADTLDPHLMVDITGNVGVGVLAPSVKLDVDGDINMSTGYDITMNAVSTLNETTLGANVINSSLTSVGNLTSLNVIGNITSDARVTGQAGLEVMIPKGGIIMWSGTMNGSGNPEVDTGVYDTNWQLCNGANGTPDLRGRFVVGDYPGGDGGGDYDGIGAGETVDSGNTSGNRVPGGEKTHVMVTGEMPSHIHTASTGNQSANHTHSGTTGTQSANHTHSYSALKSSGSYGPSEDSNNGTIEGKTTGSNSASHTHSFTTGNVSANHTHIVTVNSTGSDQAHENRPPYFILAFLMRIL